MTRTAPASRPRRTRQGAGRHRRGRLGFILLNSEETADDDIRGIVPDDVGVFYTRVPLADPVTVASLEAVEDDLTRAAALLPEALDAIAYVCTSGSIAIGEEGVRAALSRAQPGARAVSLATCAVEAMRFLAMRRIVVGTPYLHEVNRMEAGFLVERGFDVIDIQGFCLGGGREMNMVEPEDIVELAVDICREDADGIFLSCSALRSVEVLETVERRTGKPVVASNQALVWHMLGLDRDQRAQGGSRQAVPGKPRGLTSLVAVHRLCRGVHFGAGA